MRRKVGLVQKMNKGVSPSECPSRLLGGGSIGVFEKVRIEGLRGVDVCKSPTCNGKIVWVKRVMRERLWA